MITAWSYSRWAMYQECPFKAKCKIIDKLPEPDSPAAARGTAIHKLAESYLKGDLKRLPPELAKLKTEYAALRKRKPAVELELAFDKDWEPVEWFARNAWVRIKIDAMTSPVISPKKNGPVKIDIVDHKTGGVDKSSGKLKELKAEEYVPQLELYAIAGFLHHPAATDAETALYFIDAGVVAPEERVSYRRKQFEGLLKLWEDRVKLMLTDTKFAPRPGLYCRWCAFRKSEGGPCPY